MRLERAHGFELQVRSVLSDTTPIAGIKGRIGQARPSHQVEPVLSWKHLMRAGFASLKMAVIELLLVGLLLLHALIQRSLEHTIATGLIPLHLAVFELIYSLAEPVRARRAGLGHHLCGQQLVVLDLVQVLFLMRRKTPLSTIRTAVPRAALVVH